MPETIAEESDAAPLVWLDRLGDALSAVSRVVAFVGVIGMLVVSGVTVGDILLRWLFSAGVGALNEISTLAIAIAVAACMPLGVARGIHVTVDLIKPRFTRRVAAWLDANGAVLLFVLFGLISWRLFIHAADLAAQNSITGVLAIPHAPFFFVAAGLLTFAAVVQAVVVTGAVLRAARLRDTGGGINGADLVAIAGLSACYALALYGFFEFDAIAAWVGRNEGLALICAFLIAWTLLLVLAPLAAVLGLLGLVGTATAIGISPALSAFSGEVARFLGDYQIATLPLFLMMGSFAAAAGVAGDLYRLAQAVVGSFRGGLALATVAGCASFGTVTGSSLATIATFGRISLPEMGERGYAPALATGCVAAGGNLGALIPPSGPLILFALLTEASIGQLFVAALIPGILAYFLYSVAVVTYVRVFPESAPAPGQRDFSELAAALRQSGAVLALFVTVIGGMYTGVFTATEAAAVGAFLAFLLALVRGRLNPATFWQVMGETTISTALIYTLIFGALSFSFFVGITSIPERLTALVGGLDLPALAIIAIILIVYILLGCIMDSFAILVITVPIVTPLILHFGYDIVWWGIINIAIVEMSTLTPPFGIHVFVLKALAPEVALSEIFKGVGAFVAADIVKLAILVLLPIITLWLPSTMF